MALLQTHIKQMVFLVVLLAAVPSCQPNEESTEQAGHRVDAAEAHEAIHLNERMRLLANISTDTVRTALMGEQQVILGTLAIDENKAEVVSARVNGRLDRLYARNPGEKIRKGQALYAIYSEELLIVENEYLHALEMVQTVGNTDPIMEELASSARRKLQLWGLTESQIQSLATTRQVDPKVTFYSPVSGYLTGLRVREGEYVAAGVAMFEIASLSTVWVEAQVYPRELEYLNASAPVEVEFEAYPDRVFTGVPVYRSPALEKNSKIYLMRYKIVNPEGKLMPGMMAYVSLANAKKKTLSIPKSALLLSKESTVWVETAKGQYEVRMVTTGIENKERVEVLTGLKEGEVVVTSGAFLLNSKNIIDKGATHTMPGM